MENVKADQTSAIKTKIRSFVVENFLFGTDDPTLTDDASFLETGVIDSTGILELISFVESEYGIKVEDAEMLPENLDSLSHISVFVARKASA
ncbi:MAG: acyl carrier protein [bacterium]